MKTLVSMFERFINRQQVYQIQFSYPCGWKTYASYHQKSDALLVLVRLKSQGLTNCRLITSTQSSTVGIEVPHPISS